MQQNKINIINVFAKYMIMSFSCFAYKVLFSIYIYTQKSVGSVRFYVSWVRFLLLSVWFSVWLVFSSLSCVLLCSLSFSLYVAISLTTLLPFSIFLFFFPAFFPSLLFFQILLNFSLVFFWFFLAFFCVRSLDLSLFFFSFSFGFDFLPPSTPTLLFQDRVFVGILWFLTV